MFLFIKDHLVENPKYYSILKKAGLNKGGKIKENLVKKSENGDTPARDLNNYNDVLDLSADGSVGGDNGLAFSKGGDLNELDVHFNLGGSVDLPIVNFIRITRGIGVYLSYLVGQEFTKFDDFLKALQNVFIENNERGGGFYFTVNGEGMDFGLQISNAKNTVLNFNPITGKVKDFNKQIERRHPLRFRKLDWRFWYSGVYPASVKASNASTTGLVEIPDKIDNFSGLVSDLPLPIFDLFRYRAKDLNKNNNLAYFKNIDEGFSFEEAKEGMSFWSLINRGNFVTFKERFGKFGEELKNFIPNIEISSSNVLSAFSDGEIGMFNQIKKIEEDVKIEAKPYALFVNNNTVIIDIVNTETGDIVSLVRLEGDLGYEVNDKKGEELVNKYLKWKNDNLSGNTSNTQVKSSASNLLTDLENTKIWIGDNPELSKKVQERAFELGWSWGLGTNNKTVQRTNKEALFFRPSKDIIDISSRDVFEGNKTHTEIFADQLFPSATAKTTVDDKSKLKVTGFLIDFSSPEGSVNNYELEDVPDLVQSIIRFDSTYKKSIELIYLTLIVENHALKTTTESFIITQQKTILLKEINVKILTKEDMLLKLESIYPDFDFSKVAYDFGQLNAKPNNAKAEVLTPEEELAKKHVADYFSLNKNELLGNKNLQQDRNDLEALGKLLPEFQEVKFSVEKSSILKEMSRIQKKITYQGFIASNEEASKGADLFTPQGLLNYYFTQTTQNPTAELEPACGLPTPNGEKSKLPIGAYLNVRSVQFKKWFGDWEKAYETGNYVNCSKMIDQDTKEPKIYYHGVRKYIPSFGQMSNMGVGVVRPYGSFEPPKFPASYFADNESYANFYGGIAENMPKPSPDYKPFIYKVFLSVKNPISLLPLDFEISYKDLIDYILVAYGVRLSINQSLLAELDNDIEKKRPMWVYIRKDIGLLETLKDYGYDALIQQGDIPVFDKNGEVVSDRNKFIKDTEYLTFYPEQVKSATVKKSFYFNFFNDIRFKKGGYVRI